MKNACKRPGFIGAAAAVMSAFALFMTGPAFAQSSVLSVGTATGLPGTTVDVQVSLTPGAAPVTSLQFDLTLPSSLAWASTASGPAASAAGKQVSGAALPGGVRIILFGLNQNAIQAGAVAVVRLSIGAVAASGAGAMGAGTVPVGIAGVKGSAANGSAVSVSGTPGSVTISMPAGATGPGISRVTVLDVDSSSATISWATDVPADTQVEYGPTASYGLAAGLVSDKVTSHAQTIGGLAPDTLYHYRVKSRDASGNLATSSDATFLTSEPVTSLYVPDFSLGQNLPGATPPAGPEYTGIAVANLDKVDAQISFTAFGTDGKRVSGTDVTNPARLIVKQGGQLPVVDAQLFGAGSGSIGWMSVESTASRISSFFMSFNSNLSALDGATASTESLRSAILPEAGAAGLNRIYLANPGTGPVFVTLNLMKSDGTLRAGVNRQIDGNGALAADLYPELFPQAAADPSDYVLVTASGGVVPYELLAEAGKDIRILSGQDTVVGATQLYSPQYVVGGPWRSTISVINLESRAATVALHFVPDAASGVEKTALFEIPASGKLYVSDQRIFLNPGADLTKTITQGWVEISSDGARLAGSVGFGGAGQERFASALPLVDELNRNVVFSHAASNSTYFTGVALLNPGSIPSHATVDLYGADGTREATVTTTVPAGGRTSRLLTELFPALVGEDRTSGYIRVTSDWPLASFALFGTNSLSVLSAIPAQAVP